MRRPHIKWYNRVQEVITSATVCHSAVNRGDAYTRVCLFVNWITKKIQSGFS